jgi:Arc/MetJ-type ribon-helix-helix transcriptional regulator
MQKQVVISTRIPEGMNREIGAAVRRGFVNSADFFRSAIRDYLFKIRAQQIQKQLAKDKNAVKAVREFRHLASRFYTDAEYERLIEEQTSQ